MSQLCEYTRPHACVNTQWREYTKPYTVVRIHDIVYTFTCNRFCERRVVMVLIDSSYWFRYIKFRYMKHIYMQERTRARERKREKEREILRIDCAYLSTYLSTVIDSTYTYMWSSIPPTYSHTSHLHTYTLASIPLTLTRYHRFHLLWPSQFVQDERFANFLLFVLTFSTEIF
jgi:hypothetical protein